MTNRELALVFFTLVALILGGTYYFGEPAYAAWKSGADETRGLKDRLMVAERRLEKKPKLEDELDVILSDLPEHPAERDVTAQLLRSLQGAADKAGLTLLKRDAGEEEEVRSLYEVSIACSWEGELGALIRFLYDLQSQGVIFDVRQLAVQPAKKRNQLKGSFKVNCAYRRAQTGLESISVEPGA